MFKNVTFNSFVWTRKLNFFCYFNAFWPHFPTKKLRVKLTEWINLKSIMGCVCCFRPQSSQFVGQSRRVNHASTTDLLADDLDHQEEISQIFHGRFSCPQQSINCHESIINGWVLQWLTIIFHYHQGKQNQKQKSNCATVLLCMSQC